MNESLLVCIAFHYDPERLEYLTLICNAFLNEYKCPVNIIIDTNNPLLQQHIGSKRIKVWVWHNLDHPFHLTMKHRQHMVNNIDVYDNFMYVESDMYVPFYNYLNYKENFSLLWPTCIPSFVRIEQLNDEFFVTDITVPQKLRIVSIAGFEFTELKEPYHAFWIMPKTQLKESITEGFTRLHDSRELAASYPMWELKMRPLIEIKNGLISQRCYSFHLANNYAQSEDTKFAKIKPQDIFL